MAKNKLTQQLQLLWYFMRGNRLLYAGAILSIGAATLFSLIAPLVLRTTIDSISGATPLPQDPGWLSGMIRVVGGKSTLAQNLWLCSGLLLVLASVEGFFTYLKGRWTAMASEATARNISDRLYAHLQHVSYAYHVNAATGDLVQRCTSDVDTIRQFLAVELVEIGRAGCMAATALPVMLALDRRLTLVATVFIPLIFGFAFGFFLKMKQVFQTVDEAEGRISTALAENLAGVRVVRAFARQMYEIEKFDRTNREYRDRAYRIMTLMAWYWMIAALLGMAQFGAVLLWGAIWASKGGLSLGTLVVFLAYIQLLLFPIRQMGKILTDMGKTLVALGRIQEILAQPVETPAEALQKPEIRGKLEFRNVSFAYEPGKPVLQEISFSVKPGQTVAILGPTGAGKTSLVHLLARLYDYQGGSIRVDGVELKEIDKKWLREHVGLVLQESFLFSKTIKENIGLAKKSVQDAEIVTAAQMAAVHDVILNFEQGYETAVGEKGVTLSGGQQQRVAIARTLVKACPILIFDDSLSAVDAETDTAIRSALRQRNHATTLLISHRLTTLAEADVILVLDNGKLVQAGSHAELLGQDGFYRKIWAIQNTLEQELGQEMVV